MSATTPTQRDHVRKLAAAAMLRTLRRLHPEYRWKVVTPHDEKALLDRRAGT